MNPTRKNVAPDLLLRAAAEAQLAKAPQTDGRAATELLHDLQVHQIELEMQNEALRRAQQALEESRDRYVDLYEFAPLGYLTLSLDGLIQELNLRALTLLGMQRKKLQRRFFTQLVVPKDQSRWAEFLLRLKKIDGTGSLELSLQRGDGTVFQALLEGEKRPVGNGAAQIRLALSDISERKVAEEAQRIASTAFESQQGTFITDANKVILRVNKAFTEITGYTAEEALGQTPSLLKSGRQDSAFYTTMWERISVTGNWQGEIWNRRKNGMVYAERLSISAVKNDAGLLTHYVGTFSDLSSYKAAEEQINDLAHTDLLTGMSNRRKLIIRLQQAITAAEGHQHQCALLMVDLDNFKNLNDAIGHAQGDEVLQRVAKRLSAATRDGDTVARLGGDEFVVLLDHLNQDPQLALRQAQTVANKMLEALNKPYQLAGSTISCTASIGITFFGEQYEDTLEPLKRSELAMYQAKSGGRNMLRFFDPQMQAVVNARIAMEAGLREAMVKSQFLLHYQPQFTDQGRITGAEALLRWSDPKRGMVSPAEFIPLAEETGLILPIGNWVLETACRQLALWAKEPAMAHLTVAVNVSAKQFHQRDFVDQVLSALGRTGANPDRLKLELTETSLVANVEDVIAKMKALKGKGVMFSLDDFGTGYSSLSYLKRLPLDQLKIDQGFVRNILSDPNDAAIAKMVIALADSMDLAVIAEGVETEAQRELLAGLGCHFYQGYLFSRPIPLEEFEAFVARI